MKALGLMWGCDFKTCPWGFRILEQRFEKDLDRCPFISQSQIQTIICSHRGMITFLSVSKFLHPIFQPLFLLNQATKFISYFNRKSIVDHNGSPAHGKIVILIMLFFFCMPPKPPSNRLLGLQLSPKPMT